MSHSLYLFREYMGTGLVLIWFLICLLYLFCKEERKQVRVLFLYVPVILLLLFFCPPVAKLLMRFIGDEIYYRILWLMPITVVIAYTSILILSGLSGRKKGLFAGVLVSLCVVCGNYIYSNPFFTKAENPYHVPDSVVHICDAIELPGREVMAVFPLSMIQYVRQYSPVVCMPYGREILAESWNEWAVQNELCDCMESESIDAATLGALARAEGCVYIILPEQKEIKGSLSETGYEWFAAMDGYVVYRNAELITF